MGLGVGAERCEALGLRRARGNHAVGAAEVVFEILPARLAAPVFRFDDALRALRQVHGFLEELDFERIARCVFERVPLPENQVVALLAHRRRVGDGRRREAVNLARVEVEPAVFGLGALRLALVEDVVHNDGVELLVKRLRIDFLLFAIGMRPDDLALRVVEIFLRILDRAVLRIHLQQRDAVGKLGGVRDDILDAVALDGLLRAAVAVARLDVRLDLRRDLAACRLDAARRDDGRRVEIVAVLVVRRQPVPARLLRRALRRGLRSLRLLGKGRCRSKRRSQQ